MPQVSVRVGAPRALKRRVFRRLGLVTFTAWVGTGPVESGLIRLPEPVTHTIQPAPVDQPTCIQSIQSNLSH